MLGDVRVPVQPKRRDRINIMRIQISEESPLRNKDHGSTCVAQLVKNPSLGSGSGHNLTVREFEPRIRLYADSA